MPTAGVSCHPGGPRPRPAAAPRPPLTLKATTRYCVEWVVWGFRGGVGECGARCAPSTVRTVSWQGALPSRVRPAARAHEKWRACTRCTTCHCGCAPVRCRSGHGRRRLRQRCVWGRAESLGNPSHRGTTGHCRGLPGVSAAGAVGPCRRDAAVHCVACVHSLRAERARGLVRASVGGGASPRREATCRR
jgi:hypothetical protein